MTPASPSSRPGPRLTKLSLIHISALAEETPVGRLGTAEEVAKLLLYLAGEDAGYITGQVFGVNGGLVI